MGLAWRVPAAFPALALALLGRPMLSQAAADHAVARGAVRFESFYAAALGVRKRFVVYLPPSYARESRRRFPVAYFLHGRTGNESDWVARGDVDAVADSVFAAGLAEMILVMPDGDNSFWSNWARSVDVGTCAGDSLLEEAAATFCVRSSRYGDYVARNLVAWVDSAFRTQADRGHRVIAGLSMGGTGALVLALTYPDVFSAAASLSGVAAPRYLGPHPYRAPARYVESIEAWERDLGRPLPLWRARWGEDSTLWWRHDPARAARRLRRAGGPMPAIRLDVGVDDPYIDQNRALSDDLTALGIAHELLERPGGHVWAYWRDHVGETLAWLGSRMGR